MWRKAFIISIVVILGIGAAGFWYVKSRSFMATAAAVLSAEASKALDAEVKVGSLSVSSLTSVTAGDITVYDKSGEVFAAAESVDVGFSPIGMVTGASPLQAIRRVTVKNPVVSLTKRPSGEWNYQDLLSKDQSASNVFSGDVKVVNGFAAVTIDGKQITLEDIGGSFDFASHPAIAFQASFAHRGGTAEVSGNWGGAHKAVSIRAKHFNVEDYLEYVPDDMAFKLKKGELQSLDITLLDERGDYKVNGEALVLGVNVEIEGTDLEGIDGLVLFNEKELRIFSRGKVKEQPVVLRGTVGMDITDPVLNLQVDSKGFDAGKVLRDFPLHGQIAFRANIGGKFTKPIIEGAFDIKSAELCGYTLRDARAKLKFADDVLVIDEAVSAVAGGEVHARGRIDAKTQAYQLQIQTARLDAGQIPAMIDGLRGAIDGDVEVSGQGLEMKDALFYGKASIKNGAYQGVAFEAADAGFYKNGDQTVVDYFTVRLPRGEISGEGTVTDQQIQLKFYGSAIDLSQASSVQPSLMLSGLADVSGQVEGTLDHPVLRADVSAEDGAAFHQPFERLEGRVAATPDRVRVDRFVMTNGQAKHQLSGTVGLTGSRPVDLKLVSTKARAEDIIQLILPGEALTGNVDNAMVIRGTLDDIEAEGKIDFSEGSFRGVLLTEASGRYQLKHGQTTLQDFLVKAPNLNVRLSGALAANQDMNFDIVAENIDVGKVRLHLPYPASGSAKFVGKLRGNVDAPIFNGVLTADALTFNGQVLKNLDGRVALMDDVLDLTSFAFEQGDGKFSLSAGVDLKTEEIYGNLSVDKGELGAIMAMVNLESAWIGGKLDGSVDLGGTVEKPKVRLSGYMDEGHVKEYPLRHIALNVALDGELVTIHEFRAEQGSGVLVAEGKMDLAGPLDVEIAGQDIDAGLITSLADAKMDTKGILNFGAQIGGTAQDPRANLSVDIQGGGVGTATFDSLYGLFTLEQGIVHVNQLLLQKGEYKASAYGIIPVAAMTKQEKEYAELKDQMDLKISLDQADLSILPFLTKEIAWASGPTKGGVTITGTLARPLVNGEIGVHGGAVKFGALGKPIENMALELQFSGDLLELKTFEGVMGNGSYQMTGAGRITGSGLEDYRFALRLNQLEIANEYYNGPLQGELALSAVTIKNQTVPELSGQLDFANCTIDIPAVPDNEEEMPWVKLNLDVTVGEKVRLYNSFLYDIWLEGHAKFAGSTRRPQTSGEISATRGTISYLKTPFKIREASAYFNQVNSFMPSLTLEADTRLDRTKVYIKVTGPADEMKIDLTSDPEMNQAEILSLLTLRSSYRDKGGDHDSSIGRDELVGLLNIGLQMSFLNEVESAVRSALGVDEFKVVRDTLALTGANGSSDREVYNVEIGKYVNDKLMLRYTTGIDHSSYKFGARYDFSSKISLTTDIDQDSDAIVGLEARFKF